MNSWFNFYKKRPVLVTGGAGFIGSHLVRALVEAGALVTVLDNFSTGSIDALADIQHKISLLVGDITCAKTCMQAAAGKTHIFHLAAAISVEESTRKPEKYMFINVEGTRNILSAATQQRATRVIFSSSAAVYGNQAGVCHENLTPAPTSPYAQSKAEGEKLCLQFATNKKLQCIILRYFNVYGDNQKIQSGYGAVIPTFIAKLKQNAPITIFGNGLQTRDFISVDEVVRANLIAGCAPAPEHPIINVASGVSKTLLEVLNELVKKIGTQPPLLRFADARPGDVLHSHADCGRYVALKKAVEEL